MPLISLRYLLHSVEKFCQFLSFVYLSPSLFNYIIICSHRCLSVVQKITATILRVSRYCKLYFFPFSFFKSNCFVCIDAFASILKSTSIRTHISSSESIKLLFANRPSIFYRFHPLMPSYRTKSISAILSSKITATKLLPAPKTPSRHRML